MKMNSFFENLSETLNYLDDDTQIDLDSEIETDFDVEQPIEDLPEPTPDEEVQDLQEPIPDEVSQDLPEPVEPVEESKDTCENCLESNDLTEIMDLITSLGSKLAEKGLIKNFNISWEVGDNELVDKPEEITEPETEALPPVEVSEEEVFDGPEPTEEIAPEVIKADNDNEVIEDNEYIDDVWELKNASLDDIESIKIYCQIYDLPEPIIGDNNDKTFSIVVPGLNPSEKALLDSKME